MVVGGAGATVVDVGVVALTSGVALVSAPASSSDEQLVAARTRISPAAKPGNRADPWSRSVIVTVVVVVAAPTTAAAAVTVVAVTIPVTVAIPVTIPVVVAVVPPSVGLAVIAVIFGRRLDGNAVDSRRVPAATEALVGADGQHTIVRANLDAHSLAVAEHDLDATSFTAHLGCGGGDDVGDLARLTDDVGEAGRGAVAELSAPRVRSHRFAIGEHPAANSRQADLQRRPASRRRR